MKVINLNYKNDKIEINNELEKIIVSAGVLNKNTMLVIPYRKIS